MIKITNTEFLKALQSLDQFSIEDFDNRFYTDIDKLENSIEKKISYKFKASDTVYFNLLSHVTTHINASKIKFIDLYTGYVSCLNNKSYNSTIQISRSIIENYAMLSLFKKNFINALNNKDYIKMLEMMLSLSVPSWNTSYFEKYKRVHVNDALRHLSIKLFSSSSALSEIYDPISEIAHPSANSYLMYIDSQPNVRNNITSKFYIGKAKSLVLEFCTFPALFSDELINELYPDLEKEIVIPLQNMKTEIDFNFNNNAELMLKYQELVKDMPER